MPGYRTVGFSGTSKRWGAQLLIDDRATGGHEGGGAWPGDGVCFKICPLKCAFRCTSNIILHSRLDVGAKQWADEVSEAFRPPHPIALATGSKVMLLVLLPHT